MANSADPHSEEVRWSGSTIFAEVEHIRIQQAEG